MAYLCDNCERYPCTDDDYKMRYTCPGFLEKPKLTTNADRIQLMSDEELAVLLEGCICPKDICPDVDKDTPPNKKRCTKCWLDWLKQKAEDGE